MKSRAAAPGGALSLGSDTLARDPLSNYSDDDPQNTVLLLGRPSESLGQWLNVSPRWSVDKDPCRDLSDAFVGDSYG